MRDSQALLSLSKNPKLAVSARKQRFAGSREECCGISLRGSAPKTPAGTGGTLRRRFLSRSRRPAGETSGTDQCRASILYKFSIRKYLPLVKTGGVRNQAAFPGGFWGVLTKAPSLLPFPPKCSKIQLRKWRSHRYVGQDNSQRNRECTNTSCRYRNRHQRRKQR